RSVGRRFEEIWQLAEAPPTEFADRTLVRTSAAALARSGVRLVFGGLPSGIAGPVETECARRGVAVFCTAAGHRWGATRPLLLPEVNAAHLALLDRPRRSAPIVTNANCSTTGLVLGLAPVWKLLDPALIHAATYQALSGAGYPGVPSLAITDNVV